jgi:hypothetical protein
MKIIHHFNNQIFAMLIKTRKFATYSSTINRLLTSYPHLFST